MGEVREAGGHLEERFWERAEALQERFGWKDEEVLALPLWRFARLAERAQRRELEGKQWSMIELWANARALFHSNVADRDLPPTRAEAEGKKKTDWAKLEKARKSRQEHDERWMRAIASPAHFGAFLGMPQILGEPPPEEVKTAREIARAEDLPPGDVLAPARGEKRTEMLERESRMIASLREYAERTDNQPLG